MSDANLSALAYQREVSWGVPADPIALKLMRFTKESLNHKKETQKSAEIRSDRRQGESVEVAVTAMGAVDFELSVGDFDPFLESALMSAFADVGGVPTLVDGVTRTSYVMEKKVLEASGFASFKGLMLDAFTLNIPARKIITGSMSFLGTKGIVATTTIDTAGGYTAAGAGLLLSASANVGNVKKGAGGAALAGIKSLDLTINNNLRGNEVIAKKEIDEVGLGSVLVSGKMDAYFRDLVLLQELMSHADSALQFEVSREATGAVAGDHTGYRITIPKLKWTNGFPEAGGKDTDIMLSLEWEAEVGSFNAAPATIAIEKLLKA